MSQYTSYPTTSTSVNPFGSTGTITTSQTPIPTTIPPLSGVTRDSQSPSAPGTGANLNLPQTVSPQVNQATGGGGAGANAAQVPTPPTSAVSFTDTSNPYALYSSYNFGSYPTNVQAKSEPLA